MRPTTVRGATALLDIFLLIIAMSRTLVMSLATQQIGQLSSSRCRLHHSFHALSDALRTRGGLGTFQSRGGGFGSLEFDESVRVVLPLSAAGQLIGPRLR